MRPKGISFLAFLSFLGALFYGFLATGPLGMIDFASGATPEQRQATDLMSRMVFQGGAVAGILLAVVAVLSLACAIGLWTLQNWGRILTIAFIVLGLLAMVPDLYTALTKFNIESLIVQLIGVGIDVVILAYLFTPRVKDAFGVA
jgi:uncharacterized membrane protein (DUF2068 family)